MLCSRRPLPEPRLRLRPTIAAHVESPVVLPCADGVDGTAVPGRRPMRVLPVTDAGSVEDHHDRLRGVTPVKKLIDAILREE